MRNIVRSEKTANMFLSDFYITNICKISFYMAIIF